ncbi:hypothetical protein [Azospirillum sp.]|uniref:hypothetical protein n=1 Tax=Azospirillum sp. TaxID=34012 RepID=UPI003D70B0F4
MVRAFWQRLTARLVAEVPASIVVCEFDCRKPACDLGHFATCSRRLAGAAREAARRGD